MANDDLTGKNLLCADIFWGFEFKSSKKVRVINTDINKKTSTREYFYETDSKLPYIRIEPTNLSSLSVQSILPIDS